MTEVIIFDPASGTLAVVTTIPDIEVLELPSKEIEHNHAAHESAQAWVMGCPVCEAEKTVWFAQASVSEKIRWWLMPEPITPNCAACLGENKP